MNKTDKISDVGFQRWESSIWEGIAEKAVGRGVICLGHGERELPDLGYPVSNRGYATLSLCRWFSLSVGVRIVGGGERGAHAWYLVASSEGKPWGQDCLYQLQRHGGIERWTHHIQLST